MKVSGFKEFISTDNIVCTLHFYNYEERDLGYSCVHSFEDFLAIKKIKDILRVTIRDRKYEFNKRKIKRDFVSIPGKEQT